MARVDDFRKSRMNGFSLVELMIVVAIIGILSAIALPQYNEHIRKSQIVEGHTTLQQASSRLEQYFQDNRNYGTNNFCGGSSAAAQTTFLQPLTQNLKYFNLACTAVGGQVFLLTVTGQASSKVSCYAFTLDQANTRQTTISGATTAGWRSSGPSC